MWEKILNPIRKFARCPEIQALRKKKTAMVGLGIVSAFIIMAIFAGFIAPHDPIEQHPEDRFQGPSWKYPFGADDVGRDIFSRFIYGSRSALKTGFLIVALWSVIGIPLGVIAGYWRKADFIMSRAVDVAIAFPMLALAVVFIAVYGPGTSNLVKIFGVTGWVGFAMLTRNSVIRVREAAVKKTYKGKGNIGTFRHVLRVSIALVMLGLPAAILLVSAMGFLGLGVQPPNPDWGRDLNAYSRYMADPWPKPLMIILPGTALTIFILGFYLMSDWLRKILDQDETFYLPGVSSQ